MITFARLNIFCIFLNYKFRQILIILFQMDIECLDLIQQNKQQILWNSGHFFAQLGLWQDCVESPSNNSYFMANFINNVTKANATLFVGLCLPAVCRKDFIQDLMNEKMAELQPMIIGSLGVPLAVGSMDVNSQDYTFETSPWFYVMTIFFCTLIILSIASVWMEWRKKKEKQYSGLDKIVQCFNLPSTMKIFVYKHNYLNIFNGIKTICMFWVIFGHQFSVRLKYDVNIAGIPSQVEQFFYLFVSGAFLAVDVFFFIGGFLVAYSFMREKSKSILKYPMAVLHRVLRFWPSYISVILIYYSVYIHSNSGPIWKQNMTLGQIPFCSGAWKTILFVDNLVDNGQKMCMGWGWYLQNDMQIFVFSLLFIYLYTVNKKFGYAAIVGMIGVGLSLNIYQVIDREILQVTHLRDFVKWNQYFINIYIKPWIRCPPYLLGLICGLLHMEYLQVKRKFKEDNQNPHNSYLYQTNMFVKLKDQMITKRWIVWVFQFAGVVLMLTTIIIPHTLQVGNVWPYWGHALYLSLEKITFTFGVYLLIIPTLMEIPNISFFLLDTKFFNFSGKISFWIYLFHFMVVLFMSFGQKADFYFTNVTVIPMYISIATVSFFFGFLGTIFIEVPFSKLQKMLFTVLLKKERQPKKIQSESMIVNKQSVANSEIVSFNHPSPLKQTLLTQEDMNRSLKQ